MTNFHPYKRHKLMDGVKKQTVGSLGGRNASFGSLGCYPKNQWQFGGLNCIFPKEERKSGWYLLIKLLYLDLVIL